MPKIAEKSGKTDFLASFFSQNAEFISKMPKNPVISSKNADFCVKICGGGPKTCETNSFHYVSAFPPLYDPPYNVIKIGVRFLWTFPAVSTVDLWVRRTTTAVVPHRLHQKTEKWGLVDLGVKGFRKKAKRNENTRMRCGISVAG